MKYLTSATMINNRNYIYDDQYLLKKTNESINIWFSYHRY